MALKKTIGKLLVLLLVFSAFYIQNIRPPSHKDFKCSLSLASSHTALRNYNFFFSQIEVETKQYNLQIPTQTYV